MEESKKCPKCDGEMEKGAEFSIRGGRVSWGVLEGGKVAKWLTGGGTVRRREAATYRCKKCGYLESYAE